MNSKPENTLVDRAILFAMEAHGQVPRRGSSIPYVSHPIAVGILLAQQDCDEDVIAAGLLHDVVEDTIFSLEDVRARFGDRVASIVNGCSEDKEKTWDQRKSHTIETLQNASPDIQIVTCADKLHNLRSIAGDYEKLGEDLWNRFREGKVKQEWYYRGIAESLTIKLDSNKKTPELFLIFKGEVEAFFDSI
jgi:(p)ppGpp synthase/HD superfamily hydrolase